MMADMPGSRLPAARFLYAEDGWDGSAWLPASPWDESIQIVTSELASIQQKLDVIPHDETGLDIPRMTAFLERNGLEMKPFVGVDREGQQAVRQVINDKSDSTNTLASHIPILGFTYAVRAEHEAALGPEITEATLIHEMTHANHPFRDILVYPRKHPRTGTGYVLLRHGFVEDLGSTKRGKYPEEATAELLHHDYITDELGLPNGLMDMTEPVTTKRKIGGQTVEYLLPGSYVYPSPETGNPTWHVAAHAAFGMQLLNVFDPHIIHTALTSRTEPDALDEFTERVDSLSPGLHDVMAAEPYKADRFMAVTSQIIDRLYGGDPETALDAVISCIGPGDSLVA